MKLIEINKYRTLIIALFLIFFISFFLLQNYYFVQKDTKPAYTDGHILRAARYYDVLTLKNFQDLSIIEYPPFPYMVTQMFFLVGGLSLESARISVLFFSLIFLLAMFGIGYELGGSYAGAVVLSIAASSSHILDYSRQYYPDFPQTAVTALAFYCLLKTDFFKNRRFSILFGATLALSFLTKWSTGFFMIVPVLWYFFPVIINWKKDKAGTLILLLLLFFSVTGTIWYFHSINSGDKLIVNNWFLYYSLFIIIPCFISLVFIILLEKKNTQMYKDSENTCINNFTLMAIVFSSISGLWYYFAGEAVKMKFFMLTLDTVVFQGQKYEVSSFLTSMFNVFPFWHIMAVAGFVLIFIYRKNNFYRNLLLPVNIILVTLLMLKITCPGSRYLLSIIIFGSALSGYWISRTKGFKPYITIIIVLMSLFSIISWVIIPVELPPFFLPETSKFIAVRRANNNSSEIKQVTFFRADYPLSGEFREPAGKLIKSLFTGKDPCSTILVLSFAEFDGRIFPREFFQFEVFRLTGRIQTDFDWHADGFLTGITDRWKSSTPLFGAEDINDKFISRLNERNDKFTTFLKSRFNVDSMNVINNHSQGKPVELSSRKIIAEDLNRLIINQDFLKERESMEHDERGKMIEKLQRISERRNAVFLNRRMIDFQYPQEIIRKYDPDPRLEWACNNIDGVVILHSFHEKTSEIEKHIESFFPDSKLEINSCDLGKSYRITTIKIFTPK